MVAADDQNDIVHGTSVAHAGRALLIIGPAGAGKSALAMEMIGLGAHLVADDRTELRRSATGVVAAPPETIAGLIEVRGLGLMRLPHLTGIPLVAVLDLAQEEDARLPPSRHTRILGQRLALFWRIRGPHFAPALLHLLAGALME